MDKIWKWKKCSKCGLTKTTDEFYLRRRTGKYQTWCKDCQKARQKQYNDSFKYKPVKLPTFPRWLLSVAIVSANPLNVREYQMDDVKNPQQEPHP